MPTESTSEGPAIDAAGDSGATAVEYALMVTFIAIVIVTAVTTLGINLIAPFVNATAGL